MKEKLSLKGGELNGRGCGRVRLLPNLGTFTDEEAEAIMKVVREEVRRIERVASRRLDEA
ncbi:MAG: hypothetical protein ACK40X_00755 [Armatimonadota bacterium]